MVTEKPIGVLGAGPVGSILAAKFAASGQRVVVIESNETRFNQIEQDGLQILGKDTVSTKQLTLLRSLDALEGRPMHALFICTKTWSLKHILPPLARHLDPQALVIAFQNGIGPEEEVANYFPRSRIGRGIVNYAGGIAMDSSQVTMQWFNPPNYLGPMDDGCSGDLEELANVLTEVGLTTRAIPTVETKKLVFFKTILNSALNALCAASGITMRQAMTYPHTRSLARLLIREGLTVAAAVGYNYGENAKDVCMKYLDEGGDHLPSMYIDLKRQCPTEIEFINGKIVKIGMMFKNIDVDVNIFFTSAIITQEIKMGVRSPDDIPEYLTRF